MGLQTATPSAIVPINSEAPRIMPTPGIVHAIKGKDPLLHNVIRSTLLLHSVLEFRIHGNKTRKLYESPS